MTEDIIIRELFEIVPIRTSHNVGFKQVLLSDEETSTGITQIARTILSAGDVATSHTHPDMEECFFFISGTGHMIINGVSHMITADRFFRIPCGHQHEISAASELVFITIGIKI